jgi:hypothetical protein
MPRYELSLDQPNRPPGDLIEVFQVGVLENGKTTVVDLPDTLPEGEDLEEYLGLCYGLEFKKVDDKATLTSPPPSEVLGSPNFPVEEVAAPVEVIAEATPEAGGGETT